MSPTFTNYTNKYFPICFCLDMTESMVGEGVRDAKKIIETLFSSMKKSCTEQKGFSVDYAFVSFGGRNSVSLINDFHLVMEHNLNYNEKMVGGVGNVFEAMAFCLDIIQKRKDYYENNGISYRRPWLIVLSDWQWPENSLSLHDEKILKQILEAQSLKKVWVLPIEVGNCNSNNVKKVSLTQHSINSEGLNFEELAMALNASISKTVSNTNKNQQDELSPVDIIAALIADSESWGVVMNEGGNNREK